MVVERPNRRAGPNRKAPPCHGKGPSPKGHPPFYLGAGDLTPPIEPGDMVAGKRWGTAVGGVKEGPGCEEIVETIPHRHLLCGGGGATKQEGGKERQRGGRVRETARAGAKKREGGRE